MSDQTADGLAEERIRELAYYLWEKAGCPDGQADAFWHAAKAEIATEEASYDEELDESFPASDPPSHSSGP
jgi:Protein of unknown function (DUF2934)